MKYIVSVNNKNYEVEVEQGQARILTEFTASAAAPAPIVPPAGDAPRATPHIAIHAEAGEALTAPMPGTVISVLKKRGDKVHVGDIVVILEAMKMENEIVASREGTISQILVDKGATVVTGDPLVMIH